MNGPDLSGNPLKLSVGLLVASYIIGEFIFPKYPLLYIFNLVGVIGMIFSISLFIAGFSIFQRYEENPAPSSGSNRLIKTGVFAYTRNPIYLSFVLFFLSMFLIFENVMYCISALGVSIWLHHWIIRAEEEYLDSHFGDEYNRYKNSVSRWIFF